MRATNFVWFTWFSILLFSCSSNPPVSDLINTKASLPPSFNFGRLGLKVMATFVNKKKGTMSTLYGNSLALESALAGGNKIAAGEVLALITWRQQPDPNWFGANIPGNLQFVEMVKTSTENQETKTVKYALYKGKTLVLDPDTLHRQERIKYILSQKPSVMP